MTVIPFDPSRRRGHRAAEQPCGATPDGTTVREMRAQIALLQQALVQILRENAQNWVRAEAAEQRLASLTRAENH